MRSISALLLCLATLLPPQALAESGAPIAIRKVAPGSHDKLLREHLAFAPLHGLTPREAAAAAISFLDEQDDKLLSLNGTERFYRPAFAPHSEESHESLLRRAAEALALLQRRSSCPKGMNSCSDIDSEVKCCQEGTYCVNVGDTVAGGIACCPDGASCGGGVGACPDGATSCSAELGGGCCIPGYVCQGLGCVPSAVATQTRTATQDQTTVLTTSQETTSEGSTVEPTTKTETEVETTGEPTTTSEAGTTTESETEIESGTEDSSVTATPTATGSATGIAPYRPTGTSVTSSDDGETQTGCPTGFYGCLATHGGGCCRTGRNCDVHDCPAPSTTIVSNGATVVVLATDAPPAPGPSSTCADGWFLCGRDAGPVAGCCPDGYDCGTASCFTAQASETGRVQKEFPKADSAAYEKPAITVVMMVVLCVALV
ncbi:gpi anchored protein [Fusarium sp. NRRL 25303]|nr:gpi anchored protein [Fusarium sp. NRRL 25303]